MAGKKGKLIVGQSGGTTSVINASLQGVIEQGMAEGAVTGILGMVDGIEGLLGGHVVDLTAEFPSTIARLSRTPASALGSCRYRLPDADIPRVAEILDPLGVAYFVYIGGNDSADTTHRLANSLGGDIRFMSVPKTIDNDLPHTDHCPGYGSVARFVALTTVDAGRDTESTRRVYPVKIIEVMGRNAGWVPAAAALAKRSHADAPHLIYFPERHFDEEKFLVDVHAVYSRLGYAVAVVSENLRDKNGLPVSGQDSVRFVDSFGHPYTRGPADYLSSLVEERLGLRARFDKPGTIQRMAMAYQSPVDRDEAYRCGREAVRLAVDGHSDEMVTLVRLQNQPYRCETGVVGLAEIANEERRLPAEFINPDGDFVTPAFREYALPLIGDLPEEYARLQMKPVQV
ncbi:MAG: 6-phosphofructokinase [Chloroflexi bacterium]|nr:6-phosphofructokinase [Chloroflexota bacterium]